MSDDTWLDLKIHLSLSLALEDFTDVTLAIEDTDDHDDHDDHSHKKLSCHKKLIAIKSYIVIKSYLAIIFS